MVVILWSVSEMLFQLHDSKQVAQRYVLLYQILPEPLLHLQATGLRNSSKTTPIPTRHKNLTSTPHPDPRPQHASHSRTTNLATALPLILYFLLSQVMLVASQAGHPLWCSLRFPNRDLNRALVQQHHSLLQ
jgi:hypothetical protein